MAASRHEPGRRSSIVDATGRIASVGPAATAPRDVLRRRHRPPALGPAARHGRPPRAPAAAPERRPRLRARPADLARPAHLPDRAVVVGSRRRRAARAGHLRGLRGRRHDDGPRLRRRLRGGDGRRLPGGRGARDPGDPRQGDDGSRHLRPDHRSGHDPRALAARIGGPDRALARRGRRPPRLRGHARASRSRAPPRCCANPRPSPGSTGAWWQTHVSRGPGEIAEVAPALPRGPATTSTSTTAPAGSGRGRSWPTPSTSRSASWAGWSRPGPTSPTARPRTCSSAPGVMPLGRYLEAGLSVGPRVGRLRRPGRLDLLGHAGRGLRPDGPPVARRRRGSRPSTRSTGCGWGRSTARGRSAWTTSIGSLETGQGGRPHRRRPGVRGAARRPAGRRRPGRLASRLIFRAHPDMVRATWVRGPPTGRACAPMTEHARDDRPRRPADHRRDRRRWHREPRPTGHGRGHRRPDPAPRPAEAPPRPRRPDHRRDRQGRRARVHRPPQPRRPDDPGRRPPRAQGPPGRHDRARRGRRQRLRAVRAARGPRGVRRARLRPRRPARASTTTGRRSASYLARYDGTVSLNVATLVGNSPLRIAALGWDDVPADARRSTGCAGSCATGWPRARSGFSSGLDYPPGAFATTEELAALTAEAGRHGGFYHTPRPLPARRPLSRPVPRGDRDRPAGRGARPHHPLLPPRDASRAAPSRCSRSSTTPAPRGSTSRSTRIPTSGRRRGCSSSSRSGSRPAGPARSRSVSPTVPRATASAPSSRPAARRTPAPAGWADVRLGAFRRPENLRWESRSVADVMAETGHDALDVICDLLLAEDLGVSQVTSGPWPQRRCRCSSRIRSGWSAPTARSSATSRARGPTAASRGSSASSSATRRCSRSRRRSAR